jgi:hypothetical protein
MYIDVYRYTQCIPMYIDVQGTRKNLLTQHKVSLSMGIWRYYWDVCRIGWVIQLQSPMQMAGNGIALYLYYTVHTWPVRYVCSLRSWLHHCQVVSLRYIFEWRIRSRSLRNECQLHELSFDLKLGSGLYLCVTNCACAQQSLSLESAKQVVFCGIK